MNNPDPFSLGLLRKIKSLYEPGAAETNSTSAFSFPHPDYGPDLLAVQAVPHVSLNKGADQVGCFLSMGEGLQRSPGENEIHHSLLLLLTVFLEFHPLKATLQLGRLSPQLNNVAVSQMPPVRHRRQVVNGKRQGALQGCQSLVIGRFNFAYALRILLHDGSLKPRTDVTVYL